METLSRKRVTVAPNVELTGQKDKTKKYRVRKYTNGKRLDKYVSSLKAAKEWLASFSK